MPFFACRASPLQACLVARGSRFERHKSGVGLCDLVWISVWPEWLNVAPDVDTKPRLSQKW